MADLATVWWATVPLCTSEAWDSEKEGGEAARAGAGAGASGDVAGGAWLRLVLLGLLRSSSMLLCLGGRNSRPMPRPCVSERGAGDGRRRGRRLFVFEGTLCGFGGGAGVCGLRATGSGVSCGTHSSERSSSQGCVELAMAVVVVVVVVKGWGAGSHWQATCADQGGWWSASRERGSR